MNARKRFLIGLDGGVNTGFALYDRQTRQLTDVRTMTFWSAYDYITSMRTDNVEIIIEAPQLIRPTFSHGENERRKREKIASNVGSVKRESALLAEGLRLRGFTVTETKPDSAKWSNEYFQRITKWTGRTSQHGRDAARLVFGF